MQKYSERLHERQAVRTEVSSLKRQNAELKQLLEQYIGKKKEDALIESPADRVAQQIDRFKRDQAASPIHIKQSSH